MGCMDLCHRLKCHFCNVFITIILTLMVIVVLSIIRALTRYGRDGANYTSRATFDCFYDPENHDHVIIDYQVWSCRWKYMYFFISFQTSPREPNSTCFSGAFFPAPSCSSAASTCVSAGAPTMSKFIFFLLSNFMFFLLSKFMLFLLLSKFMFTSDDGHMRIFCCGKAVTGVQIWM